MAAVAHGKVGGGKQSGTSPKTSLTRLTLRTNSALLYMGVAFVTAVLQTGGTRKLKRGSRLIFYPSVICSPTALFELACRARSLSGEVMLICHSHPPYDKHVPNVQFTPPVIFTGGIITELSYVFLHCFCKLLLS